MHLQMGLIGFLCPSCFMGEKYNNVRLITTYQEWYSYETRVLKIALCKRTRPNGSFKEN